MAFRIQGQRDAFDSVIAGVPSNRVLDAIDEAIDWAAVRAILARGYDLSGKGWTGIDPIVLFKMLLLEQIYNLSDVRVSTEAGDRISFRRFLALSAGEAAPDDTTLVKFRRRMRAKNLLEKAHEEFNRQLAAKGLLVRPGAIKVVDATMLRAATRPPKTEKTAPEKDEPCIDKEPKEPRPGPSYRRIDTDARFGGKKRKLIFGYKVHAAMDVETGMITHHETTAANVSDMNVFGELLDGTESAVLADKGYDSKKNREVLGKIGAEDGIMRRVREKDAKGARVVTNGIEKERNKALAKLRSPSEGNFGVLKRFRRLGRAVYTGIERVREQVTLAVLAHNLLKAIAPRGKCA